MIDLVGEYHHKLDSKGRVSLPSDFRKVLSKDLKVSLSPENDCLYVFEPEGFTAWVDSVFQANGGYRANNAKDIKMRRWLNSRARGVELDNAGRIGISADHREKAGLCKEVVLVGNTDHLEIWDAQRWEAFNDSIDVNDLFCD